MDISAGIQASLAGRYASALFDLASENGASGNGTVTAVEADLDKLAAALAESGELALLTSSPKVTRIAAQQALAGVARVLGLGGLTQNFLGVLAQNRRLGQLPAVIRAFCAIAAAQRGEIAGEVTSAHALSDAQIDSLKARLTAREGRTVKLSTTVDPDLLGGLVVTIGSRRIDASIRTRLNSLAQAMKA
ncbi:MAG: F0F1 ATP synthase subunit delta [Erythrobacter sp.]